MSLQNGQGTVNNTPADVSPNGVEKEPKTHRLVEWILSDVDKRLAYLNEDDATRFGEIQNNFVEGVYDESLDAIKKIEAFSVVYTGLTIVAATILGVKTVFDVNSIVQSGLPLSGFAKDFLSNSLVAYFASIAPRTMLAYLIHFIPTIKRKIQNGDNWGAVRNAFGPLACNIDFGWMAYPFITEGDLWDLVVFDIKSRVNEFRNNPNIDIQ